MQPVTIYYDLYAKFWGLSMTQALPFRSPIPWGRMTSGQIGQVCDMTRMGQVPHARYRSSTLTRLVAREGFQEEVTPQLKPKGAAERTNMRR